MEKVKLDLRRKTLDQKLVFASNIVTRMTGNSVFPNPTPALADITTQVTALNTKKADVASKKTSLEQAQSDLDQAERALDTLLTNQGAYIQSASGGDGTKIVSAGVELASKPVPIGELPPPQDLRATGGDQEGEADCMWEPVRGASSYVARCGASLSGPWTEFYNGTVSKCTNSGLTAGQEYFFQVCAVGPRGRGPWSDIARKRAT